MNAMDVALICKALGDANRLEIDPVLSKLPPAPDHLFPVQTGR